LIGQPGINLIEKAEDVIAWKRLVILTEEGMHTLTFDPEANTGLYWILRRYCPHAWGVPFPAGLHPPTSAPRADQWTA